MWNPPIWRAPLVPDCERVIQPLLSVSDGLLVLGAELMTLHGRHHHPKSRAYVLGHVGFSHSVGLDKGVMTCVHL